MQTQVEFAAKSIGYCSWAAACYQAQRNNGTGHHAALRVLAYKWDRILFRCWKDRIPYDEATYINALIKRNSPLVKLLNLQQPVPAQPMAPPTKHNALRTSQSSWSTAGEIITHLKQSVVENTAEIKRSRSIKQTTK